MPLDGIYLLTIIGALVALVAPLEVAFAAVLAAWMILPAGLILPGLFHIFLVDRIVLAAFILRLVLRFGRPGEPTASAYRLTPLHAAWAALLLVGYVDGALLSATSLSDNLHVWLTLVDCSLLLVAALAVLRTLGVWKVLRSVAVVTAGAIGIGLIERVSGHGWAAYLSEHVPSAWRSNFVFDLGTRGGTVRAQGAAEFALEYGWVLAMLLPLLVVAVSIWVARNRGWGWRRLLLVLLPAGGVAGVVLSQSRSPEIALAVGAVLLVLASGAPKQITVPVLGAGAVVLAILALAPSLFLHSFSTAGAASTSTRESRLGVLFSLVAHRPFLGLGYTGFHTVLVGLDNAYAETYGQLGVVGLLAWVGVLVTSLAVVLRTMRAPRRSPVRQLGAACAIGIVAAAVAAAAYDFTFTEQSMWTLVLLSALGAVLSEHLPARAPAVRSPARLLLPMAGAAVGALVLALAPVGWSRSFSLFLITPKELAIQHTDQIDYIAQRLGPTVCGYLDAQPTVAGTTLDCTQPSISERSTWEAQVTVAVTGGSAGAVAGEAHRALGPFLSLGYTTVAADGAMASGKSAWATTAPLSGAFAGLMVALVVPPLRRRRDISAAPAALVPSYAA